MEPAFASTPEFSISSPAFADMGPIPPKYTCDGDDISPPLEFRHVPPDTVTLAIFCEDPDAPNVVWDHWVRFNIHPTHVVVAEGGYPGDGSGKTTGNSLGWQGPCPPLGEEHRYIFRAYALSARLDLPDGVTKADVERAMDGKIIARAAIVGTYRRPGH